MIWFGVAREIFKWLIRAQGDQLNLRVFASNYVKYYKATRERKNKQIYIKL